jgi:hypothetical protein
LKYLFNLLALLLLLSFSANAQIYVDIDANAGTKNGTSWTNAYTDLQNALDAASVNDQIWVATGTYLPTASPDGTADNRNKAFHLATDMKVYGGFAGTETQLSARNAVTNITILSGDFIGNDIVIGSGSTLSITDNTENAYHVMITAKLTVAAVIDGFTIKGGNANGNGSITYQSAFYGNRNGGGIYNYASAPTVTNTTFLYNTAVNGGGMVNVSSSSPIITNTTFLYNTAEIGGGGMYNYDASSPIITNTTFLYNTADGHGGGMSNGSSSSPTITNTTFSYNTADGGGGMYNYESSSPIIKNSIFWENLKNNPNSLSGADIEDVSSSSPTVSYCLTQASSDYSIGTGIINNQDPLFVDAANGDFSLQSCSPAINVGTATGITHTTDILENPRVGTVDMGAYEYQGIPYSTNIYVNATATGTNDGSSWADAYTNLQNAIDNQCGGFDIWVAAGTYYPTDAPDGTTSTGATDRNNAFHLHTDMKIYGGFAGTETQLSERVGTITTLSGDLRGNDIVTGNGSTLSITNNTENAYHVMITANLTVAAVIDGFTIKGGNANGNADGSGSINYQSKKYGHHNGGGMHNSSSSPTIMNTIFSYNTASYFGGGMINYFSSSPTITNTTFSYNTSGDGGGGMVNVEFSSPIITNTTFSYNTVRRFGGGMYNYFDSSPTITNTTFLYNTAGIGGGMSNGVGSSPTITNTIFWENVRDGSNNARDADISSTPSCSPTVSYCLTQENSVYDGANNGVNNNGTGIINNQDPLFVDAANGDCRLRGCSPAINAGTETGITHTTDILGNLHVGTIDMGAYEYQGIPYSTNIYVNINATGTNDGSSWTNAHTDLQDAIDHQCGGFDIWVAAGTYLPTDAPDGTTSTGATDRNNTFHFSTDMKIYGGFDGTETQLSARNAATNITILSGDFNTDDGVTGSGSTLSITNNTENAYHVMITANLTVAAVIDGFTIKGGNANESGSITYQSKNYNNNSGGGMYNSSSSPIIKNTTFLYNSGGGMFNGSSSPIITNTTFSYNTAVYSGGGMVNAFSSSPTITNTTFSYNTVVNSGGGMYNGGGSPTITNTTFLHNTAKYGGGMYNGGSSPTITNTTFLHNTADDYGGGMVNSSSSSPTITNSIFWENLKNGSNSLSGADIANVSSSPTVSYCLTQNYSSGTGIIINEDPLFVDAANGDFSLLCNSPAINTGTTVSHTTDILGNPHVGIVDMGAYEYQVEITVSAPTVTQPTCIVSTGEIIVNATTTTGTLQYSIDDGATYQASNTFSGLAVGSYAISVREQGSSCTETYGSSPVVINAFIITVSAPTVTQPCTVSTGEIIVNASTTTGTLEYSIDNGTTYQASNTFSGLVPGSYTISVNEQGSSCTETYSSNPVVINALINYTQIYVKTGATAGSNDGSSWANAFINLQDAIDANCNGVDIWVAAGTYKPTDAPDGTPSTGATDRNNAFHLATDMKIYGGFDGTETLLSQRDAATNITILSGDFSGDDGFTGSGSTFAITGNTENAYHVMITANLREPVIDGFTIKGGNANGSGTIDYQSKTYNNSKGGGMYNYACYDLMIKNSIFSYNTADEGGGMYNNNSFSASGPETITNTTFSYNTAGEGGGMYNYNSFSDSGSEIIVNTTFLHNTADDYGGGMYNHNSAPTFRNTVFSYNTADEGGGGMYNYNSAPTITNTTFSYNTADEGGGMNNFHSASLEIFNTTFSYNTARNGGGMYNIDSEIMILNTVFSYNTADEGGGGMYNKNSFYGYGPETITNTTFSYNTADDGGGMVNDYSDPTITNTTFSYNTAFDYGGGMYNFSSSPIITNTTFSYNTAGNYGGGMFNNSYSSSSSSSSSPIITNTVFWGNLKNGSNSLSGADIENNNFSSPTVTYCLTQENSVYDGANNGVNNIGTGIINNQDPLFVDAANGDFSLQSCSPAINAGTATGITHTTDILRNPHVGMVDMGAYEFKELDPITITANITNGTNPNYSGVPSITSEGAILNTNNAVFKAQNYIELLPGFSVAPAPEQATVFRAEIEGCE